MKKICLFFTELIVLGMAVAPMASAVTTFYVTTNGTGNLSGTDWANATNNLQGAIDAIETGAANTVWVSNGVYQTGGMTNYPDGTVLTNRVAIWKAITVRSANNDPANTIIKGAWDPSLNGPGPAAVRSVFVASGASLIGFTLTNGATRNTTGYDAHAGNILGGGSDTSTISNCVVTGGYAYQYGGGMGFGTFWNCVVRGNKTETFGGGTTYGNYHNCTIYGNLSVVHGGGASGGTYYNCTISNNYAGNSGGGAEGTSWGLELYDCLIIGNEAVRFGGGVVRFQAGDATPKVLYNCTIVGNKAGLLGGGIYQGVASDTGDVNNCIIYFNDAPDGTNWYGTNYFRNSCTIPAAVNGEGVNITNDPMFVANGNGYGTNHVAGNYRLSANSPGINTGTNQSWMTTTWPYDLDGRTRIRYGTVDMGAYEFIHSGTIFRVY